MRSLFKKCLITSIFIFHSCEKTSNSDSPSAESESEATTTPSSTPTKEPTSSGKVNVDSSDVESETETEEASGDSNTLENSVLLPKKVDLLGSLAIVLVDNSEDAELALEASDTRDSYPLTESSKIPEKTLSKYQSDGTVVPIQEHCSSTATVLNSEEACLDVSQLYSLESFGFLLEGDFEGYSLIWLKNNGDIIPIDTQVSSGATADGTSNVSKFQFTSDGKLWFLIGSSIWKLDLTSDDLLLSNVTDENQSIGSFFATDNGAVFIHGSVSGGNSFERRITASGGFEVLPSGIDINFGFPIQNYAVFSNRVINVENDIMNMSYLPISIELNRSFNSSKSVVNTTDLKELPVLGNGWLVPSQTMAVDIKNLKVADKPQTSIAPYSSMMDSSLRLTFDGTNVVTSTFDSTAEKLSVNLYKTLVIPYNEELGEVRVERMFGLDQGFTTSWKALLYTVTSSPAATTGTRYFFADVNSQTGVVDMSNAYEMPSSYYPNNDAFYQAGGVVFQLVNGLSLKKLSFNSQAKAISLTAVTLNGVSAAYPIFVRVHDESLYLTAVSSPGQSRKLFKLTPSDLSLTELFDLAAIDSVQDVKLFTSGTDSQTPIFVGCPSSQNCKLYKYANWNFTSAPSVLDLGITEISSNGASSVSPWYFDTNGVFIFAKSSTEFLVLKSDFSGVLKTSLIFSNSSGSGDTNTDLILGGVFRFGQSFAQIDKTAPWGDDGLMLAGLVGTAYRVKRVDITKRTETAIVDLNGVQVYFAGSTPDNFILNGLRLSDNQRITMTFDMQGLKLSTDTTSNVKFVKLIPINK